MPTTVRDTAGTATVELTIPKKPEGDYLIKPISGCFVKNDNNLQHFVQKSIHDSADRNKFDPANCKYIFYSPVKDFKGTVTKAVISYEKISRKRFSNIDEQKTKTCTVENPLIITFDGHFFLCCDSKDLNKSKFLEEHSKEVRINQRLHPNKEFYGLGKRRHDSSCTEYLQLIPFDISHCRQSQKDIYKTSAIDTLNSNYFEELIEAGPLLLVDGQKTIVVGCYRKWKSNCTIKVNVFRKSQGDPVPALPPPSPTEGDATPTLPPPGTIGDATPTLPPLGPTGDNQLSDQTVRFLYDQLRLKIISCLEDYCVKNGRGTLDKLKHRFRGFLCKLKETGRKEIKTVENLIETLEDRLGVIGPNNVEMIKMLAEELELRELKEEVEKFQAKSVKVTKGSTAIYLKTVFTVLGVELVVAGITLIGIYTANPEKLESLQPFVDFGVQLLALLKGSVVFVLEIRSISSLKQLWQSYKDGSLKNKLKKSFNEIEELKELSKGEEIDVEVTIDEKEYREALFDLILIKVKGRMCFPRKIKRRHSVCCERDVPEDESIDGKGKPEKEYTETWRRHSVCCEHVPEDSNKPTTCTMVNSCVEFVRHSNSIGKHGDSLRCLKEILPSAVGIPSAELRVYQYLSLTYEELKEYDEVILHAKKWIEIAQNMGDKETKGFGYQTKGDAFLSLACYDDALDCGEKCLEIAQETGSVKGEIMAYKCMMLACSNMQKHDETILYAHKLLDFATKTNDKSAMTTACLELGRAHLALNRYQDAIDFGKKCIEIAREIEDRSDEFSAYLLMGRIYSALSDHDNAIIYCKKCIDLAITIGDKRAEAAAYSLMGEVYYMMGKYDAAISNCNQCLYTDKEDKDLDVIAYFTLGRVNQSLKKYDKAIQNYKQCINNVDRIGRAKKLAAKASLCLGQIYQTLKQYNDAVYYSKKCIDMARETGVKSIEALACLYLGQIYQTLGQYKDALYYSKKCIDMAQETGEKRSEARACLCLGQIYQTLGQYNDSVYCSKKCIDMAQETGDKQSVMEGYCLLAQEYLDLNQLHAASLSIDAGMAISTGLGDKETKDDFKKLRSSLYAAVGLFDNDCDEPLFKELFQGSTNSEDDLLEDLAQAVKTADKMKRHFAYLRLYIFYQSKKDHDKAILCLEQLKEMNVSPPVNLFCISAIGNSYQMMGQDDKALRCYKEGLPIAESCSVHVLRAKFYYNYSKLLISLKKELNLAERYLREAIRCFEAIFATLGSRDEFKISIFEEHIHSYKLLAFLLISGKQFEEALLVLDRCRARALKDLMMANYKIEQEESNDEHLEYRHDVLPLVSEDFSISFYSLCSDDLHMFFLEREKNFHFSSSPSRSLQMYVDTWFEETGVRELVHCEDRSLDKEQDIQKEEKRSEEEYEGLNQPTASLLDLDSNRGESNENSAETKGSTLEVLFDILECDKILSSKQDEVVVIPEGPLYNVPFPALRDPRTGKYLSETKRIRLAPSLATLKLFKDSSSDQTNNTKPLVIGSPSVGKVMMDGEELEFPLIFGALSEAINIADILGVRPLVKAHATKTAVLEKLREGPSIVHIATYGILSKATIILAPSPEIRATKIPDEEDYMLTMADVQQAQVRAQLVVLSCCHSGRDEIRAEGVVGMCRAFLASGARAVVASLWAIDDKATLRLMLKFYSHLKDGKSASVSLHEAMKQMRNTTRYSEPKYWAPFFLMGDDVTIKL